MKKIKKLIGVSVLSLLSIVGISAAKNNVVEVRDTRLNVIAKEGINTETLVNQIQQVVGLNYRVINRFDGIFNGVEISVNSQKVKAIRDLNVVSMARGNHGYLPSETNEIYPYDKVLDSATNNSIKDMNLPSESNLGKGTVVAILDSSFTPDHDAFCDMDGTGNKLTKNDVEEIQNSLTFHARDGVFYNNKIPFLYDYGGTVTKNSRTSEYSDPLEDTDTSTVNSYHGMHVASIACANGEFKGVAPNAQLAFMKVFSDVSDSGAQVCFDSTLINALNDAYELGVDVVNLSLGTDFTEFEVDDDGGTNSQLNTLFDRLTEKGVQVSISAGNNGLGNYANSGAYANLSPLQIEQGELGGLAATRSATTVASSIVSDDEEAPVTIVVGGKTINTRDQVIIREGTEENPPVALPFSSLIPLNEDYRVFDFVVVPGVGKDADYEGLDVKDKIAVVTRGDTTFVEKIAAAKQHGAIACIICNDTGLGTVGYFALGEAVEGGLIPTLSVGVDDGKLIKSVDTKQILATREKMSDFSTEGALGDLTIKPEITAPGTNIAGALNVNNNTIVKNKYTYISGTSMAAPNYAGAVATILSDLKETEGVELTLKNRNMTTATVLKQGASDADYSVRRQGAGVVNIKNAESGLYLTYKDTGLGKVELGNNEDISKGHIKFDVELHNEKHLIGTYDLSLKAQVPETVFVDSETYPEFAGKHFQTLRQRLVEEFKSKVYIGGDALQTISIDFSLNEDDLKEIFDVFENGIQLEGFLKLTDENLPSLSIPFLGFVGEYSSVDCVEDFDFERDSNSVYQSQLMNKFCAETGVNLPNANFESCIVGTTGGLEGVSMEDIFANTIDIKQKYRGLKGELGPDGLYHIACGIPGYTDTIIIQQFVNRTVVNNDLTFFDARGNDVLDDHMFDSLTGGDGDYTLYKTMVSLDLISGNTYYLAHRAYTIIPLSDYPDGSYKMHISYELMDGSIQTRDYVLDISSEKSSVEFNADFTSSNSLLLEFSRPMEFVQVGGIDATLATSQENSYIYTIDLNQFTFKNNIFISCLAKNFAEVKGVFSQDGKAIFWNNSISNGYRVKFTETPDNGIPQKISVSVSIYNTKNMKATVTGDQFVTYRYPTEENSVYKGIYKLDGATLVTSKDSNLATTFKLEEKGFIMLVDKVQPVVPTEPVTPTEPTEPVTPTKPTEPTKPSSFPVIPVVVGGAILVAAVVVLVVLLRKKK